METTENEMGTMNSDLSGATFKATGPVKPASEFTDGATTTEDKRMNYIERRHAVALCNIAYRERVGTLEGDVDPFYIHGGNVFARHNADAADIGNHAFGVTFAEIDKTTFPDAKLTIEYDHEAYTRWLVDRLYIGLLGAKDEPHERRPLHDQIREAAASVLRRESSLVDDVAEIKEKVDTVALANALDGSDVALADRIDELERIVLGELPGRPGRMTFAKSVSQTVADLQDDIASIRGAGQPKTDTERGWLSPREARELRGELNSKGRELADMVDKYNAAQSQLDAAQAAFYGDERVLDTVKNERDGASVGRDIAQRRNDELIIEVRDSARRIAELEAERDSLQACIDADSAEIKTERDNLHHDLAKCQQERDHYKANWRTADKARESALEQRNAARKQLDAVKDFIGKFDADVKAAN